MRKTLLQYLVCPGCQAELRLTVHRLDREHVMDGELRCTGCGDGYPIRNGVPIVLHAHEGDRANAATAERFGQQWEQFDFIDVERYTRQFLEWIVPVDKEFFTHKLVLDAGCGKGRHCVVSSQFQARDVIGVDLAEGSVNAAFRNTRDLPNVHIIRADLYHLPFLPGTFDYVYSIGVLHHTPDPKGAFGSLVRYVKPGGRISAWVYGQEGNWWILNVLNPIRLRITSRLPLPWLKALAFVLAGILDLCARLLYLPANTVRLLHPAARVLPLNDYVLSIARYPFREKFCIVFDHLLPEIAVYVNRQEFLTWFEDNHLQHTVVTPKTRNSWRGTAEKP